MHFFFCHFLRYLEICKRKKQIFFSVTRVTRDKCVHFDNEQPLSMTFTDPSRLQGLNVISFDLLIREVPLVTLELHCPEFGTYKLQYSSDTKEAIVKVGARTVILGYADDSIGKGNRNVFSNHQMALKSIYKISSNSNKI